MLTGKHLLFIILIAVAAGMLFMKILQGGQPVEKPVIIPPAHIVKEFEVKEVASKKVYDSIAVVIKKKDDSVTSLKKNIRLLKQNATVMEVAIKELQQADSSDRQEYNTAVNDYISNANEMDTACMETMAVFGRLAAAKDSLISAKDTAYTQLSAAFRRSINELIKSVKYSDDLNKQLRKKKFGNTFWKSAAMVAAVVITANVLK
ncbi:MAG: hypothetical protein QM791_04025 [Ferruginibacter sp.]